MNLPTFPRHGGHCRFLLRAALLVSAFFFTRGEWRAQAAQQGPITPPPEHDVRRVGTEPVPPAPPSIPPEEIIKRFSQKEDEYLVARRIHL